MLLAAMVWATREHPSTAQLAVRMVSSNKPHRSMVESLLAMAEVAKVAMGPGIRAEAIAMVLAQADSRCACHCRVLWGSHVPATT